MNRIFLRKLTGEVSTLVESWQHSFYQGHIVLLLTLDLAWNANALCFSGNVDCVFQTWLQCLKTGSAWAQGRNPLTYMPRYSQHDLSDTRCNYTLSFYFFFTHCYKYDLTNRESDPNPIPNCNSTGNFFSKCLPRIWVLKLLVGIVAGQRTMTSC